MFIFTLYFVHIRVHGYMESYVQRYSSFSSMININTNYSKYNANLGENRKVDIDAFSFRFFTQNSLKFKKTWTAELSGMYNAPTVMMGTFKMKAMWMVDAGIQKQVLSGKGVIKASVSDIFRGMQFRGTTDFAGQQTTNHFRWESRQFKLNFTYRFGNSQVKAARQRATGAEEENRRVNSGGNQIGQ